MQESSWEISSESINRFVLDINNDNICQTDYISRAINLFGFFYVTQADVRILGGSGRDPVTVPFPLLVNIETDIHIVQ